MQVLTAVLKQPRHAAMFSPSLISQICEGILLPNALMKEADLEMLEDDPAEFIRRDIEGSDMHTRRKGVFELSIALCDNYEQQSVPIITSSINSFLAVRVDLLNSYYGRNIKLTKKKPSRMMPAFTFILVWYLLAFQQNWALYVFDRFPMLQDFSWNMSVPFWRRR